MNHDIHQPFDFVVENSFDHLFSIFISPDARMNKYLVLTFQILYVPQKLRKLLFTFLFNRTPALNYFKNTSWITELQIFVMIITT